MLGKSVELNLSKKIHGHNKAILISSLYLRRKGLGQIDISYLNNHKLILVEVKSSLIGRSVLYKGEQIARLRHAALVLSFELNMAVELKIIAKR